VLKKKYQQLKKWFEDYTEGFFMQNKKDQDNIVLKIDHSQRVVAIMDEITDKIGLDEDQKYLALITALFHDIGRFKQYKEYQTFSDYKSEDHGQLGVEVIKENRLIEELGEEDKNIIYKSVKYHNKAELEADNFNNAEEIYYTELIRDADKIDIFNIFVERYKNEGQEDFIIKLSEDPEISDEIYHKVLNKEAVNYDKLRTLNELKLMQLSWIYDINFKESLAIIKERKYIESIYNSFDNNKKAENIYNQIKEYIESF